MIASPCPKKSPGVCGHGAEELGRHPGQHAEPLAEHHAADLLPDVQVVLVLGNGKGGDRELPRLKESGCWTFFLELIEILGKICDVEILKVGLNLGFCWKYLFLISGVPGNTSGVKSLTVNEPCHVRHVAVESKRTS